VTPGHLSHEQKEQFPNEESKTEFDAFVIQLPNSPFRLSRYQGDLTADSHGNGVADFIGRFSKETFIVAPGSGPALVIHRQPIHGCQQQSGNRPRAYVSRGLLGWVSRGR